MNEDFLYFLWKTKNFDFSELCCESGQKLEIQNFGVQNMDSGPDFSDAEISLDGARWVGNVEMHIRSSDWDVHRHSKDKRYNTVILHVVWEHDKEIRTAAGQWLPVLELKSRVRSEMKKNYERLRSNPSFIPCDKQISLFSDTKLKFWIERLGIERLETKSEKISEDLELLKMDWEEAFYRHFASCFGLTVNVEGFRQLAQAVPLRLIRQYSDSRFKIQALLYGQAGMLTNVHLDKYPTQLRKEYEFLQHKHRLDSIDPRVWKLSKMRPQSFPTIRIAQLSELLFLLSPLLRRFIECQDYREALSFLELETHEYWNTHFLFEKESRPSKKQPGLGFKERLMINAIIPFLYAYGKKRGRSEVCEKALVWLRLISSEKNKITKAWSSLDVKPKNAFESQALIHLYKNYCNAKRCLDCSVGCSIIKQFYTLSEEGVQYRLIQS